MKQGNKKESDGEKMRALFYKVVREGLHEKVMCNLGPEYKTRTRSWETAFQEEGRDSANVLRCNNNTIRGKKSSTR